MIRTYEFLLHGHSISDTEFYYFSFFDTLEIVDTLLLRVTFYTQQFVLIC